MPSNEDSTQRLATLRKTLGPPAFDFGSVLLYEGDCLQLMSAMPSEHIDLTVTSPPYNIGKEYERPLPLDQYIRWSSTWIGEVHRLTAGQGAFWLNLGYTTLPGRAKAVPLPYLLWDQIPFFLVQEIIWNYGAGVAARTMFSPRNEKWLWYVKDPTDYTFNLDDVRDPNVKYPNQKKNGRLRVNPAGKNPTDVWQIPKVTTGAGRTGQRASAERTNHPAQFPEACVDRIIRASSRPGDIILDPFGGSGTTAAVALASGRACVIFETRHDYVQIAAQRIAAVQHRLEEYQSSLFTA